MSMEGLAPAPRRRLRPGVLPMAGRAITALVGGYGAAAVLATLLARLMPVAREEATAWGMVLSFLIYGVIGLWCFHERRLARVALGVWGVALVGGISLHLLGVRP